MAQLVLFLDDGGVISDNQARAPQWQRLVGPFFAARLGGAPAAWAEANRLVMEAFFAPGAWTARLHAAPNYAGLDRAYLLDWLGRMCLHVGVAVPPADEAVALARAANAYIIRRVQAGFPGAADAVRALHAQGYLLYTASGEGSPELAGYLTALDICDCFERLYGPDLVDAFKAGPLFYTRIFADAGVAPGVALVVDDSPEALGWAASVGARTVLVGAAPGPLPAGTPRIARLADLPALLPHLG